MPRLVPLHALGPLCASLLLASACNSPTTSNARAVAGESPAASSDPPTLEPALPDFTGLPKLRAAGVELAVAEDWRVLAESDPNFALAVSDIQDANSPWCSIELRRQGPGPLPREAKPVPGRTGVFEYRRATGRGRVRLIPNRSGSTTVVHCRAPRSAPGFPEMVARFDAMTTSEASPELGAAPPTPGPDGIVELCTGSRARDTTVCVRRGDGRVECGETTDSTLTPITLPEPAAQISCIGASACARTSAGVVHCWSGTETPLRAEITATEIVGDSVVDDSGKLLRRTQLGLGELLPLDDPKLALTEVEHVLLGARAEQGCVVRAGGQLWCWDAQAQLHRVGAADQAEGVVHMGDRVCLARSGRWGCLDLEQSDAAEPVEVSVDDCAARACGCTLFSASLLACETDPLDSMEVRPLGRISNVALVSEPCAVLTDDVVVCRGPAGAAASDELVEHPAIATELPGIAHILAGSDPGPDPRPEPG